MSMRPRFGGGGSLRLPACVSILRVNDARGIAGDVVGEHGLQGWDPFERTTEGLLLAEGFARIDLERPRKAQAWYLQHGVLDVARMFPDESASAHDWPTQGDRFHDSRDAVLDQQRNVRWHLLALARLSTERSNATPPLHDWEPHEGWNPAWSQPALKEPQGDVLWLGASSDLEAHIPTLMQHDEAPDDLDGALLSESMLSGSMRDTIRRWWPAAHRAWQRIAHDRLPLLWVPRASWDYHWIDYSIDGGPPSGRFPVGRLSADWHGLVELERRLIEPYVRRAADSEVLVEQRGRSHALSREGESWAWIVGGPLEVHERRWWGSLLAPVYLQLFEGLRRITEGHSGAAICRECGEPFLTLDARRSSFCNDRERFRYTQRERRRRISAFRPGTRHQAPR